jgi:hypothetical protein
MGACQPVSTYECAVTLYVENTLHSRHTATVAVGPQPGMFVIINIHLLSHCTLGDVGPNYLKTSCMLLLGVRGAI